VYLQSTEELMEVEPRTERKGMERKEGRILTGRTRLRMAFGGRRGLR